MMTPAQLLKQFNKIKTLPHVAIRLTKLMADEHSSMQEFEKIIKMDPTLVLRLLRLVNSPYYGLSQKVDSITRAVIFIGMIVEDQVATDLFAQTCIAFETGSRQFIETERKIIGTDHSVVGYLLAYDWKLPIDVQKGIRRHHSCLKMKLARIIL